MTKREKSLFEAHRKRFKEYLTRKFPPLQKHKPLTSENKIIQSIPLDYLNRLVWHYKLFDEICKKPSSSNKYPKHDFKEINQILKRLKRKKWLKGNDDLEINKLLYEKLYSSPEGIEHQIEKIKLRILNRRGGRWVDYALDFLIYFLVEYTKEFTGKPNYELIDILITKHTKHKNYDYNKIQARYKRIRQKKNKLWMVFTELHHAYFQDYFKELFIYKDFRRELNADFIEYCLPQFIDFYPPQKKKFLIGNKTKPPLKK